VISKPPAAVLEYSWATVGWVRKKMFLEHWKRANLEKGENRLISFPELDL